MFLLCCYQCCIRYHWPSRCLTDTWHTNAVNTHRLYCSPQVISQGYLKYLCLKLQWGMWLPPQSESRDSLFGCIFNQLLLSLLILNYMSCDGNWLICHFIVNSSTKGDGRHAPGSELFRKWKEEAFLFVPSPLDRWLGAAPATEPLNYDP